jgi:hypothetical protein
MTDQKAATITGVSFGAGLIAQFRTLQFGVMWGRDYAAGAAGAQWVYNAKDWFGLSFGLSFFGRDETSPKQPST